MISVEELLDMFFTRHDFEKKAYSTQYRSAIWYQSEEQKAVVHKVMEEKRQLLGPRRPIHTKVHELGHFYRAEEYHQKYLAKMRGTYVKPNNNKRQKESK